MLVLILILVLELTELRLEPVLELLSIRIPSVPVLELIRLLLLAVLVPVLLASPPPPPTLSAPVPNPVLLRLTLLPRMRWGSRPVDEEKEGISAAVERET